MELRTAIATADSATSQSLEELNASVGGLSGSVRDFRSVVIDPQGTVITKAVFALDANGRAAGIVATNTGAFSRLELLFNAYNFLTPSGSSIFEYADPAAGGDGRVHMPDVVVRTIEADSIATDAIKDGAITLPYGVYNASSVSGGAGWQLVVSQPVSLERAGTLYAWAKTQQFYGGTNVGYSFELRVDGEVIDSSSGVAFQDNVPCLGHKSKPAGVANVELWYRSNAASLSIAAGAAHLIILRAYK